MEAVKRTLVFSVSTVVLFGLLLGLIRLAEDLLDRPPITAEVAGPIADVGPDGALFVDFSIDKERQCSTWISQVVRSPQRLTVWRDLSLGGNSPLGRSQWRVAIQLPKGLEPGEYTYHVVLASDCGHRTYNYVPRAGNFKITR